MNQKLDAIFREVQKALTGKQAVVEKVLMAMLCGGHILLDDVPGVGKRHLPSRSAKRLGCAIAGSSLPRTFCRRISSAFPCTTSSRMRSAMCRAS